MKITQRAGIAIASVCALAATSGCSISFTGGKKSEPSSPPPPSATPSSAPQFNGIDNLSASEVVDAASDALRTAPSVHIAGTVSKSQLDLRMDSAGNCQGRITEDGTNVDLIKQGSKVWLKPDHAFWVQAAGDQATQTEALVGDRYIVTDSSDPEFSSLADACDIAGYADSMTEDNGNSTVNKGVQKDVRGVPALELVRNDPQEGRSQLYIARTGKPYPLEIHGSDQGSAAGVVLDEYGKPLSLDVPSASESLDAAQLS
ncbi:hypothetical protein [Streptomyces sp. H51]|uniref:hypothetical protein n=1 Tax=Streptomyces sp. H51 TaxID=3111770 RepID=UPI002D786188|nr:hypothetical protein [Streptomyces sp. H51]